MIFHRHCLAGLLLFQLLSFAQGAQRKTLNEVDMGVLGKDLQVSKVIKGTNSFNFAWWIPVEYWGVAMAQNKTLTAEQKSQFLKQLDGVSMLAVCQADISSTGVFSYYPYDDVQKNLSLSLTDDKAQISSLEIIAEPSADLRLTLKIFEPILEGAMGNLGKNMHFFVLNDRTPTGARIVDPYLPGEMSINLKDSNQNAVALKIATQANALFVPRLCPNGEEARISWKYCPWTGEKLAD